MAINASAPASSGLPVYPGYTDRVAKVMVSLPDDLLGVLDAEAARRGTTRSGLLRDYIAEGLRHRAEVRASRMRELLDESGHHGGRSLDELKRGRPS